ncbi:T-cell surface antigen CD2 [Camelus dromedarius]|uniref:T-cell surface antigen CD2 n=1 Tax=Camelus dromedarius TaxID=9838 RepID=A0A5N4DRR5_CAMDR|nr:T-cell surface antigen CD2 [Camelus dromedarius]
MSLACNILASCLLLFTVSTKGAVSENKQVISGVLNHDISLDIPDFQMSDSIDDIQWSRSGTKVAQFKRNKTPQQIMDRYMILTNGTLKIKDLKSTDRDTYKVAVYDTQGKHVLDKLFDLKILVLCQERQGVHDCGCNNYHQYRRYDQRARAVSHVVPVVTEMVSKPVISWSCTNRTLICEAARVNGSKLELYINESKVREDQQIIKYKWNTKWKASVKCVSSNEVSKETNAMPIRCSEKGLDIYLIIGICGGGTVFLVFVALLIFYISKRKKQSRRRNDEELETGVNRVTPAEERGRKSYQIPGSTPPNPAMSQTPPTPGHRPQTPAHRPQAPAHRPGPPGPRVQHAQKKRPPPTPGTQGHQQKGPPLPKPRVQSKPLREAEENV